MRQIVRRGRSLSRRYSRPSRALWCLFLLPLACSTTTTQYVRVPATPIPASLLSPCPISPPPDDPLSYGGAVLWNELMLTDLQNCNGQIDGIKQIEEARQK